MSTTRPDRRVLTFYSFKGGVGRTMALANVAFRLADLHALRVIVVDWDLEAPGLHVFFGIGQGEMARARGVLDYFEAWTKAARRGAPKPPDITRWLIPIDRKPLVPRHGAISLLVAGRLDDSYDKRLAALDWGDLYASRGGALAVETIRKQLVEQADVVLIDSRTGLTDAGGICTIQLPDGVVLIAAPNQQSIDGIERVARSIRKAGIEQRAGRPPPRTWVSICRVSSVEETTLADQWFKDHEEWFKRGAREGLWLEEDHQLGLQTYELPHRARWAFGEALILPGENVNAKDPLSMAYDGLTAALLGFCVGPLIDVGTEPSEEDLEALRKRAADAEQRKDIPGLLAALVHLANKLTASREPARAIEVLSRAIAVAIGANLTSEQAALRAVLGTALAHVGRLTEALEAGRSALQIARDLKDRRLEAAALFRLAMIEAEVGNHEQARATLIHAMELMRSVGDDRMRQQALQFSQILHEVSTMALRTDLLREENARLKTKARVLAKAREDMLRAELSTARESGDSNGEAATIESLLDLASDGYPIPDEAALRARLASLKSSDSEPASPPVLAQSAAAPAGRKPRRSRT